MQPLSPRNVYLKHVKISIILLSEHLSLYKNHLYGSIPFGIDCLSIMFIHISANDFTGTIPEDVLLINSLESLFLEGNLLTGTIPEKHGDLSKLVYVDFGENFLSGTIPNWITEAPALNHMNLDIINLSGKIPENLSLEKFESSKSFSISEN